MNVAIDEMSISRALFKENKMKSTKYHSQSCL